MLVADVMSKNVQWAAPEATAAEAAAMMRENDYGALPVGKDDRLVGMVTDRDIATRCCADGRASDKTRLSEIMTDKLYYCRADTDIEKAAANMAELGVRRLPVVDEGKRLVGIVSLGDIAARGDKNVTNAYAAVSSAKKKN